jgi:hypothetical protein
MDRFYVRKIVNRKVKSNRFKWVIKPQNRERCRNRNDELSV